MKKLLLAAVAALTVAASAGAQVLSSAGIENTLYTGFGAPLSGSARYYGVLDTIQARTEIGKLTLEGMLNWGAIANNGKNGNVDNFVIAHTPLNPLQFKYGWSDNSCKVGGFDNAAQTWATTLTDDYYVNFIYHFSRELDFGLGTKLNWSVGTAPRYGAWLWESDAHVRQGGFSTSYDDRHGAYGYDASVYHYSSYAPGNMPGSADVVGFAPFANKYGKTGLGVRYITGDRSKKGSYFQAGAVIPQGFNTDHPVINVGAEFGPVNWILVSAAYEGLFQDGGNFFAGATFDFSRFVLDVYAGYDGLFRSADDGAMPTGAAITLWITKNFCIRPEAGINFFEDDNYDFAFHSGCQLTWILSKQLTFMAWGSFAVGSKDKRWDDKDYMDAAHPGAYDETKDWDGGHILNLRPEVKYSYDKNNSFAAYIDIERREAFDGKDRNCWSSGIYWTHKVGK